MIKNKLEYNLIIRNNSSHISFSPVFIGEANPIIFWFIFYIMSNRLRDWRKSDFKTIICVIYIVQIRNERVIDGSSSRVNIIATPNPAMGEAALDVVFTLHADDKRSKSSHMFCLRFYRNKNYWKFNYSLKLCSL